MSFGTVTFGVADKCFLSGSVETLNPPMPVVVHQETPLHEAIEVLKYNDFGCLVVTGEEGKVVGIVTERDLLLKLDCVVAREEPVKQIMTISPHTEQMTCSIAYALSLMSEGGFRHIPIVDEDEKPIAIISVRDIVDYIVRTMEKDSACLSGGGAVAGAGVLETPNTRRLNP